MVTRVSKRVFWCTCLKQGEGWTFDVEQQEWVCALCRQVSKAVFLGAGH